YTVDKNFNIVNPDGNALKNINTFTYEFYANGEFTFEFKDRAGNKGTATAKVDWIDTTSPIGTVYYDEIGLTNQDVKVNIEFNEKDVTVTNNGGKTTYTFTKNGEFTFEFKDAAGNTGKTTAKVDWIDKTAPTAELKYDKSSKIKAVVKVVNLSESITYYAGNGIYEFTKNGRYQIAFYDKAGNAGILIAVIDWLEEEEKPNLPKPGTITKPSSTPGSTSKPSTTPKPSGNTGSTNKPSTGGNASTTKPSTTPKPSGNTGSTNKPSTGGNASTTKPSTNTKPSNNTGSTTKPSTGGNTSTTIPGTTPKPSGNTGNTTTPNETENTYKSFQISNISIKVPTNVLTENDTLKRNTLTLNNNLKNKFSSTSEYFEVYFSDELSNKIDLDTTIQMTITLNKDKEFAGIYEIQGDSMATPVNYQVKSDGVVEIETNKLGKYVIFYKEEVTETPTTTETPEEKPETTIKKHNDNLVWFIASGAVATLGLSVLVLKKKEDKNNY
ncbi:MAG: hypothetical protein K2J20_06440, partial [Bacilli bacterium]|nr:hypothetical protein [Bacilli bacterium]